MAPAEDGGGSEPLLIPSPFRVLPGGLQPHVQTRLAWHTPGYQGAQLTMLLGAWQTNQLQRGGGGRTGSTGLPLTGIYASLPSIPCWKACHPPLDVRKGRVLPLHPPTTAVIGSGPCDGHS
jgi:hypothetical protein